MTGGIATGFKQIRHRRIYEEIIVQIKSQIASGELTPGDRMLSEREIAEQLGVSRSAVREALIALEVTGLLEVRQGDGTFVKSPTLIQQLEPLTNLVVLEREQVLELQDLRLMLEVECAGRAAERATPEQLAAMAAWLDQMESDIPGSISGEEADYQFHLAIAEGAQNGLILRFMQTIAANLRRLMKVHREQIHRTPDRLLQLLEEHRRIYEAIRNANEDRARHEMRLHLNGVFREVLHSHDDRG